MSPRIPMKVRNVRVSDRDWNAAHARAERDGDNLSEKIREFIRAYGRQKRRDEMTDERLGDKSAVLTAEPGDVIEFENRGQRFGGVVWESPTTGALRAGDTFIGRRGEWIATMEHVVSVRRRNS